MSDTLAAVQDMLVIDPDKIVLPDAAVADLSAPQIDVMKETVAAVQTSFAVAGAALRSAAAELYRLKGIIPSRKWTAFLESGALPVSKKQAQDLVNAYEYIRDMGLTDGDLIHISSRSLNILANASDDVKKEGAKRLKAGEKMSESSTKAMRDEIDKSNISDSNKKKLKININAAEQLKKKDEEIQKLKATNAKLKKEISNLKAIKALTVKQVMQKSKFQTVVKDAIESTLDEIEKAEAKEKAEAVEA